MSLEHPANRFIGDKMVKKKGLDPLRFGLLENSLEIQNKITDRMDTEYQRMVSLAESMDLGRSPINWYQVALKLAKDHVPKLKENKPLGAKVKWGTFEKMVLGGEIYRLKIDGCTIKKACEELAKMDVWKNFLDQKENTYDSDAKAALLKQYNENSPDTRAGIGSYLYHVETNDIEGWQNTVSEVKKK